MTDAERRLADAELELRLAELSVSHEAAIKAINIRHEDSMARAHERLTRIVDEHEQHYIDSRKPWWQHALPWLAGFSIGVCFAMSIIVQAHVQ